MLKFIREIVKNKAGATAIEYGLIAALVSVAAVTALTSVGTSLDSMFTKVSTTLDAAVAPPTA
jgi:pilus assembly protein Flp/PilA